MLTITGILIFIITTLYDPLITKLKTPKQFLIIYYHLNALMYAILSGYRRYRYSESE